MCHHEKLPLNDESVKELLSEKEIQTIRDKSNEILDWIKKNPTAEILEYREKLWELESVAYPILKKYAIEMNSKKEK